MLISEKGKYFHVFGCILKNFPKNIFWCLEKKKENTNQKTQGTTQKIHKIINDDCTVIAIGDRDLGSRSRRDLGSRSRCDLAFFARSRSRLGLELAISDWSWSSQSHLDLLLSRARARSLSLSHFPEML